jgi:hypothetical protein
MMPETKKPDTYGKAETQRRLEAIMRGAFSGSPQPMKDIPRKRAKKRKSRKAKASAS